MSHPEIGGELSPDKQMIFDQDLRDLREAAERFGVSDLEGRVKYGLDPAAMMVVRDSVPLSEAIARSFGTTGERAWPFIKDLHSQGPWRAAGRLSSGEDAVAKTYLVLVSACREAAREEFSPAQYMADRKRVMDELGSFSLEQFDKRKDKIRGRVKNLEIITRVVNGAEAAVPVAEGDVALPLAMDGYRGCVSRAGEMYSAQASDIPDAMLEEVGLVRGFGERLNPSLKRYERVDPSTPGVRVVWVGKADSGRQIADMVPVAKRIAPGYVLAYGNREIALDLVARAISQK